MDESFVVAVFVARAELQMAVEEEAKIVFEASEDEMLVARVAGEDDVVGVDVVLGGGGDAAGVRHADSETTDDDDAGNAQNARAGKLVGKQIRGPKRDAGVDETEEHGRADEAEIAARGEWEKAEKRRARRGSRR